MAEMNRILWIFIAMVELSTMMSEALPTSDPGGDEKQLGSEIDKDNRLRFIGDLFGPDRDKLKLNTNLLEKSQGFLDELSLRFKEQNIHNKDLTQPLQILDTILTDNSGNPKQAVDNKDFQQFSDEKKQKADIKTSDKSQPFLDGLLSGSSSGSGLAGILGGALSVIGSVLDMTGTSRSDGGKDVISSIGQIIKVIDSIVSAIQINFCKVFSGLFTSGENGEGTPCGGRGRDSNNGGVNASNNGTRNSDDKLNDWFNPPASIVNGEHNGKKVNDSESRADKLTDIK